MYNLGNISWRYVLPMPRCIIFFSPPITTFTLPTPHTALYISCQRCANTTPLSLYISTPCAAETCRRANSSQIRERLNRGVGGGICSKEGTRENVSTAHGWCSRQVGLSLEARRCSRVLGLIEVSVEGLVVSVVSWGILGCLLSV